MSQNKIRSLIVSISTIYALVACVKIATADDIALSVRAAPDHGKHAVEVTIENNGDVQVTMPLLFICEDYYLRFRIIDEENTLASFIGPEIDWIESANDYVTMYPVSKFSQVIDLSEFYALSSRNYQVEAIYEIQQNRRSEEHLWVGRLQSNVIHVSRAND
jgi:hypothetical protein